MDLKRKKLENQKQLNYATDSDIHEIKWKAMS